MLKKAPSFVLSSQESSTYPGGYASGSCFACGLAGWPFWASCWKLSRCASRTDHRNSSLSR